MEMTTPLFIRLATASSENRTKCRYKAFVVSTSGPAFLAAASEIPAPGEQEIQSWNLNAAHAPQGHPHTARHTKPGISNVQSQRAPKDFRWLGKVSPGVQWTLNKIGHLSKKTNGIFSLKSPSSTRFWDYKQVLASLDLSAHPCERLKANSSFIQAPALFCLFVCLFVCLMKTWGVFFRLMVGIVKKIIGTTLEIILSTNPHSLACFSFFFNCIVMLLFLIF